MSDIDTTYSVKTNYSLLPMPVLLIWGEKDTFVTPLQRAKEIAREIPKAKLVVIPNAGHLALYTKTDRIIEEIVKFILK